MWGWWTVVGLGFIPLSQWTMPWSILPSQGRTMGLPASTGSGGSLGAARAPRNLAPVKPHCPPSLTCAQVLAELLARSQLHLWHCTPQPPYINTNSRHC